MSERQKAILTYLVLDLNAEIACWEQSLKCFSEETTSKRILEKLKILESKIHVYKEFVKNIQTLFEI